MVRCTWIVASKSTVDLIDFSFVPVSRVEKEMCKMSGSVTRSACRSVFSKIELPVPQILEEIVDLVSLTRSNSGLSCNCGVLVRCGFSSAPWS